MPIGSPPVATCLRCTVRRVGGSFIDAVTMCVSFSAAWISLRIYRQGTSL
jgi:hypothetical protein